MSDEYERLKKLRDEYEERDRLKILKPVKAEILKAIDELEANCPRNAYMILNAALKLLGGNPRTKKSKR